MTLVMMACLVWDGRERRRGYNRKRSAASVLRSVDSLGRSCVSAFMPFATRVLTRVSREIGTVVRPRRVIVSEYDF